MNCIPHCRVDNIIARYCKWTGAGRLEMWMPVNHGITAGTWSRIFLSTRGNDNSATTREGFDILRAGRF